MVETRTDESAPRAPSGRRRRRVRDLPLGLIIGSLLVAIFVGMGLVSLVWTPFEPGALDVAGGLSGPGTNGHLLGTDRLGKDVLTLVMTGARNSLFVSVLATTAALVPGVLLGLAVAGSGTNWQGAMSRVIDLGIALPGILIALVLATALGAGNLAVMIAIFFWFIPVVARVTLGPARQILTKDFVEAAFAYGRSRWFILTHHVLPNIAPLIIVQASIMFAAAILIEASLAYLGIGAQPPTPSWGRLLNEAQPLIEQAPHLMIFPGIAIMIAVLGFNLLGDGLRVVLDPQQMTRGGEM